MAEELTKGGRVLVVDDPSFDEHADVRAHPEHPERLDSARCGLYAAVRPERRVMCEAPWASEEDLGRAHQPGYLRQLDEALRSGQGYLDGDTFFSPGTREAVHRAAGGAIAIVEGLARGDGGAGFLLQRPPGHHATTDRAMGFCMLNHIAIAAASALASGTERVAIVDWDVHHGNGTQAIFESDPRVLFISLHQWPLYPGTGRWSEVGLGAGRGTTINVAFPAGTDGAGYAHAFRELILPRLRGFAPELLLVSAGFDAHSRDPLAGQELDDSTYFAMATALLALGVPTAFVLEGGYDLIALEGGVAAVGRALMGERLALPEDRPRDVEREAVALTLAAHAAI